MRRIWVKSVSRSFFSMDKVHSGLMTVIWWRIDRPLVTQRCMCHLLCDVRDHTFPQMTDHLMFIIACGVGVLRHYQRNICRWGDQGCAGGCICTLICHIFAVYAVKVTVGGIGGTDVALESAVFIVSCIGFTLVGVAWAVLELARF